MPNSNEIRNRTPTEEELSQLPRWAVVAFAARCALRVQPLFKQLWLDAPEECVNTIDRAITFARTSAANPAVANANTARGAANAAAANASHAGRVAAYAASDAADAAAAAAYAAARTADDYYARTADDMVRAAARAADRTAAHNAYDAVRAAAHAAHAAHAAAYVACIGEIWRDFERLKHAAQRDHWDNSTPVPPEFFGPLWPEGEPEGWPAHISDTSCTTASLSLYFDMSEYSASQVTDVIASLSDLYAEIGGDELVIDSTGVLEIANVPAGVDA